VLPEDLEARPRSIDPRIPGADHRAPRYILAIPGVFGVVHLSLCGGPSYYAMIVLYVPLQESFGQISPITAPSAPTTTTILGLL
jgi:hypothetical protein